MIFQVRPALMKHWAALGKRNIHLPRQAIRSDAAIIHETGRLSIAQGELDIYFFLTKFANCVDTSHIICFNMRVQESFHFLFSYLNSPPGVAPAWRAGLFPWSEHNRRPEMGGCTFLRIKVDWSRIFCFNTLIGLRNPYIGILRCVAQQWAAHFFE